MFFGVWRWLFGSGGAGSGTRTAPAFLAVPAAAGFLAASAPAAFLAQPGDRGFLAGVHS